MELLLAIGIGMLFACGTWLLLRARTFPVLLGLTLFSYAVNLLLVASGRIVVGGAPLTYLDVPRPDPLPQALVLTAIVIGFAMTAVLVALALRAYAQSDTEHVDGAAAPAAPVAPGAPAAIDGSDEQGRAG